MNIAACLSSNAHDWETPAALFADLDAEFGFTLDPYATAETAKCKRFFTQEQDGLAQSWAGEVVFCNPPYGRAIRCWVQKAWEEAGKGAVVVLLIPARTDTVYWHDYCFQGEVRFLRGRVHFRRGDITGPAPFPSAVVIFRSRDTGGATGDA